MHSHTKGHARAATQKSVLPGSASRIISVTQARTYQRGHLEQTAILSFCFPTVSDDETYVTEFSQD